MNGYIKYYMKQVVLYIADSCIHVYSVKDLYLNIIGGVVWPTEQQSGAWKEIKLIQWLFFWLLDNYSHITVFKRSWWAAHRSQISVHHWLCWWIHGLIGKGHYVLLLPIVLGIMSAQLWLLPERSIVWVSPVISQ